MQAIHPAAGIIGDEAHPKRVLYITSPDYSFAGESLGLQGHLSG